MKVAFTALAAALFAVPAIALDYDKEQVKSECSAKWGTEYDMVKYCIDARAEGFANFVGTSAGIPENIQPQLQPTIDHCEAKWGQEWDMTAYCLQENIRAMASIPDVLSDLPGEIKGTIVRDCSAIWGAELDMVAYCAGNRAEGWRAINK